MKKHYFDFLKLFLLIASIPIWFIKKVKYLATIPTYDENQNFVGVSRYNVYVPIIENLKDDKKIFLIYITFAIAFIFLSLFIYKIFKTNSKGVKVASNIAFVLYIVFFIIALITGISISRKF